MHARGQKTTFGGCFSLPSIWILGIKYKLLLDSKALYPLIHFVLTFLMLTYILYKSSGVCIFCLNCLKCLKLC